MAVGLQLIAAARTKKKASERKRELSAAASEMAMRFTCVIMKSHKWRGAGGRSREEGRKEGGVKEGGTHKCAYSRTS